MRTEPGISEGCTVYYDMDFEAYCRLDGINASAVKGAGGCSPRHLKAYLDGDLPNEDTPAKRLGRAIHCLILEPDRFLRDLDKGDAT